MIQSFRKFSESRVAKVFLALVALSFVAFFGGGSWWKSRHPYEVVAEVGSTTIDHRQFLSAVHERMQLAMAQRKGLTQDDLIAAGLPQAVLSQMVQETLLNLEAAHLGLTVSDEAVRTHIHSIKAFAGKNGKFDRALFANALRTMGMSEDVFILNLRKELIREQLLNAITVGTFVPDDLADLLFDAYYQTRKASMILVAPKDMPARALPDVATLEAFYKEHQKAFAMPEVRDFTILTIDSKALDAGVDAYQLTQDLDDKIAGGATLEELTKGKKGITLVKIAGIDAKGRTDTPVTALSPELAAEILQTGFALESNTDSPFSQGPGDTYYMVRVDKITPAGQPAFADIKDRVGKVWIQAEQFKAAQLKAEAMVKQPPASMKALPPLSLTQPTSTVANEVKSLVFALRPHQTEMTLTPQGFAVVRLDSIVPPVVTLKAKGLNSFKEDLLKQYKEDVIVAYLNALNIRYPVKINQEAVQALLAPRQ